MASPNLKDDFAQCLSDRKLFSLYVMYPDMEGRLEELQDVANSSGSRSIDNANFSPTSAVLSPDEVDSSHVSDGTTRATTLRPYPYSQPPKGSIDFLDFQASVAGSVLPKECTQYFCWLGQAIFDVGYLLFSQEMQSPFIEKGGQILRITSKMIRAVQYSSEQVDGQISRLTYLKSLLTFNCKPDQTHLWSTYRQRTKLVISHSALPCRTELDLLEQLAHLYDAYVYNSALYLHAQTDFDHHVIASLHNTYDSIMTWLTRYKQWCGSMQDIRQTYLLPLMTSMIASPKVIWEIKEIRISKDKALTEFQRHKSAVSLTTGENPMEALKLSTERVVEERVN